MGNNDECINFMKESLSLCIRSCGAQSRQAGVKYYEMAIRELKAGKKKEALDNFQKARVNMESHQNTVGKYSILLMKLAELYLNNGKIDDCIEHSSKAIRSFDDNEKKSGNKIYEKHKIKAFEILSRAY